MVRTIFTATTGESPSNFQYTNWYAWEEDRTAGPSATRSNPINVRRRALKPLGAYQVAIVQNGACPGGMPGLQPATP